MAFGDLVQSNTGTSALATTAPTLASGVTSGNLIVLTFAADDYNGSPNAGWTQSTNCEQQFFHGGYLWWFIATSNGQTIPSYTIGSAVRSAWTLIEYAGPFNASPYDTSNGSGNNTSGGSFTSATMTPTAGSRLLVGTLNGQHATSDISPNWTSLTGITGNPISNLWNGANPRLATVQTSSVVTASGSTTYSIGGTVGTTQSHSGMVISFVAGSSGTNASAGLATATAAALGPSKSVSPTAGLAQATATANNPTATKAVSATAALAQATATANGITANASPTAGVATATATANNPNTAGAVVVGLATATATANNPTVSTSGNTSATAGVATATATANGLSETAAPVLGVATATATAYNPTANTTGSTNAQAGVAQATATANGVGCSGSSAVGRATATATAYGPQAAIGASPGRATATATVLGVTVTALVLLGRATATATANNVATSVPDATIIVGRLHTRLGDALRATDLADMPRTTRRGDTQRTTGGVE